MSNSPPQAHPESPALAAWLARIEQLHPSTIELGLERVGQVWQRLHQACNRTEQAQPPQRPLVITVAGTNGKGSVCATLEAICHAAGYRTGVYASPHLNHYCERVRIDTRPVSDADMVTAFERVEAVRADTRLTYFEFGTLAAFQLFQQQALDLWILEVGMGGRLDAVNLIDADVAVITNIALDHVEWLGNDRDSIAREKAGILRAGRPALFGEQDLPGSLRQQALSLDVPLYRAGVDFSVRPLSAIRGPDPLPSSESGSESGDWEYSGPLRLSGGELARRALHLPPSALPGVHQRDNASLAISALGLLADRLPVAISAIIQGLTQVRLAGRFQILRPQADAAEIILDVAHNPHGAEVLATALQQRPCTGRTHCVFSALQDKDLSQMLPVLAPVMDEWWLAPLSGARGRSLAGLQEALGQAGIEAPAHGLQSLQQALMQARKSAGAEDRIVVCGSFLTVAAALAALD